MTQTDIFTQMQTTIESFKQLGAHARAIVLDTLNTLGRGESAKKPRRRVDDELVEAVFEQIRDAAEPPRQVELARAVDRSPTVVLKVLTGLIESGRVTRSKEGKGATFAVAEEQAPAKAKRSRGPKKQAKAAKAAARRPRAKAKGKAKRPRAPRARGAEGTLKERILAVLPKKPEEALHRTEVEAMIAGGTPKSIAQELHMMTKNGTILRPEPAHFCLPLRTKPNGHVGDVNASQPN